MEKQWIEEIAANRMQVIAPLLDPTVDHARYEELKADTAGKFQVSEHEAGREDAPRIAVSGSTEIRHLGMSIQRSYDEIDELMKRIVHEQNVRRKSEIDALQSQINPHFLYNTLDSITWMVEGEKNEEAVAMISELAKLLRISLSGGRTIIRVQDEIQHARSYMNIQKVRYKERFEAEFDVSDDIFDFCTVKNIVQSLLENALYYGVGEMDPDDGGRIRVTGRRDGRWSQGSCGRRNGRNRL